MAQRKGVAGSADVSPRAGRAAHLLAGPPRETNGWLGRFFGLFLFSTPPFTSSTCENSTRSRSPPLIALAVYALVRRRYPMLTASLFFALLCKEDVSILTLAFGIYLLFDSRSRAWGIGVSLFSVAWLLLALQVIIPAFREEGEYGSIGARYGYLGATPREALKTLITRPGVPLVHLFQKDIGAAFLRQLLPTGFVALLGWPLCSRCRCRCSSICN